jgi:NitT/TauT family transport system substrate-binding protein
MNISSSCFAMRGLSLALAAGLCLFASMPAAGKNLRVGVTNTPSDAGLFIADKKGFFRQEGLDVTLMSIANPADMLEALRTGAIDIGGSIVSPLLFNVAANARIKVVADRGSPGQPNNHFSLLVRADHMVAGRFQTLGDLRGMRIAVPPMAVNNSSSRLMAILQEAGLDWDDVRPVEVGIGQYVGIFNRSEIDAAIGTEPVSGFITQRGQARRIAEADRIYPDQQVGVLLYSSSLISGSRTSGERFMRAYLRGVRMMNEALIAGRLAGPNSDEVVQILTEYTAVRNQELLRSLTLLSSHSDGLVGVASMNRDLAFFKSRKWIEKSRMSVEDVLDRSFADKAARDLGRGGSLISRYKGWNDG